MPRLLVVLRLVLASGILACAPPASHDILLVTLDTTRADRLGLYGYDRDTTPTLDRLAEEATVFDLAMAQAAVTPVSHASILTGLAPYHHGLRVLHGLTGNRLPDEVMTLAEVWGAAGGRSAAFVSAFPVTDHFGLAQGFDHFDADFGGAADQAVVTGKGIVNTGTVQRRADETTTAAINWLREESDDERPLFLWLHYFDPHDTLLLPPRRMLGRFGRGSDDREQALRDVYDDEIYFMDAQIGRLLDAFRSRRPWDKTIVAVVADHGEGLGDHDWWSHGILYQEQIRVPLLIRLPGVSAGRRVSGMVRTTDLAPTLLEAAGIPRSSWPEMDGSSLLTTIRDGEEPPSRLAYADSVNILTYGLPHDASRAERKADKLYSLTDGRSKLIYHQLEPGNTEFYDLSRDPAELSDLAASRPPEMIELMRRLRELDALSDILPGAKPSDLERAEKLESLGYIE